MCRFVAYQGPGQSPHVLVFGGDHSLYHQSYEPRELLSGSVNADGYGVVWYHDGRPVRLSSPSPIWQNPDLEGVLRSVRSETVVAALRNVTPGIPPSESAVPPVTIDQWSFVLNGYVEDFRSRFMRRHHAAIPDSVFGRLTGVSDTEALALMSVGACVAGASPAQALEGVVRTVAALVLAEGASAQLNMVLTDGETVAVCRASSGPVPNSLYLRTDSNHDGNRVVLASEPLSTGEVWSTVSPQSLVEVRRGVPTQWELGSP